MPFLVEVINRDIKNSNVRFGITVLLCVIIAALLHIPQLMMGSVEGLLSSMTLIFAESQVVFKLYFQDSTLRASMQRPEVVTTP
jgi:hypothetical protein